VTFAGIVPASLVDFPGHVAVTVFVAGCNLRCPYCHNPGLVTGARTGRPWAEGEVLELLRRRQGVLSHLCVSGGEPTLQPGLPAFLAAVRGLGVRVKLDTNGSAPARLEALLRAGLCDYVAMDVKTAWARYGELGGPGAPAAAYRRSAALVRALAPDYEFRTTVVPGLVGHAEVRAIARDLTGARRYVLQQFVARGPLLDPRWAGVAPYPPATLRQWAAEVSPCFQEPVVVRNV
jgi:pyruvate formate lyase activating enzyme